MSADADEVCMEASPRDAPHVAVLCTMPADHAPHDHVATNGRRFLASWTIDGVSVHVHADLVRTQSVHMSPR